MGNHLGSLRVWDVAGPLIQRFEGFRPKPYRCPAGVLTVGYGHTLPLTSDDILHVDGYPIPLTQDDGLALLAKDCAQFWRRMIPMITVDLTHHQAGALVSFAYNVGLAAFQRSTLRQKLNRGDLEAVPTELLRWVRVRGQFCPGLFNRRSQEAAVFRGA